MAKRKGKVKEIERVTKGKSIVIGARRVIKLMKLGKIKKVILAKDLEQNIKGEIENIAKIFKVEIEENQKSRREIAEELKKPFAIGCIGIMK